MKLGLAMLATLALAAGLTHCGTEQKDKSAVPAAKKLEDPEKIAQLNAQHPNLPQSIITRVPMVDGKPAFGLTEAVFVNASIDLSSPAAVNKAFEEGLKANRTIKLSAPSDKMEEGSSSQFLLPWRRWTNWRLNNLENQIYYGAGKYCRPYPCRGSWQYSMPYGQCGYGSSYSSFSYSYYQSSGSSWNYMAY